MIPPKESRPTVKKKPVPILWCPNCGHTQTGKILCTICGCKVQLPPMEDKAITSKLNHDRRGFQIMARKMVEVAGRDFWQKAMEDGKYERAGGDVECPACRQLYFEHPQLPGFPTFHLICSGEVVKT